MKIALMSDLLALPAGTDGSITCHDGYALADGSSIKLAVLGHTPGTRNTTSFGVRVFLEFPAQSDPPRNGRQVIVFNNFSLNVVTEEDEVGGACDEQLLQWCKEKSIIDLAALANWVHHRLRVTITNTTSEPDDLSVRFAFAINMAAEGQPDRIIGRSMSYHANVIPGFFIPGSGKAALTLEGTASAAA